MKTLSVDLGERSYPIFIGPGLIGNSELLAPHVCGRQVLVVTNETIAPLYLEAVLRAFDAYATDTVILPDGEEFKNIDILDPIFEKLLRNRHDRRTTLVALGGGVVGDITGFAAACYQRGVAFIQIPTTLLAQVDSSVGGKTGVNHRMGKNMIGAFHQPRCVLVDTETLSTLDDRQLRAGLAEVIKYGLIRDPAFFNWLEKHIHGLLQRSTASLEYAIEQSCRNKAAIVAADELEAGLRAQLNLGHSFGHAIETGLGYGRWLHGEAVAAGMFLAADMSARMGWIGHNELDRLGSLLEQSGLPLRGPAELSTSRMLELMAVDKKNRAGKIRLVLLQAIGSAIVTDDFDPGILKATLNSS
ncbi:MAG: 3-dehydroquinate synthase [Gammaproteobacteria bacterium]|nr:3-dehydroquinate synthase [Gammaproteobacteria bacterium]